MTEQRPFPKASYELGGQRWQSIVAVGCVVVSTLSLTGCGPTIGAEDASSDQITSSEQASQTPKPHKPMEQITVMSYNVNDKIPVLETMSYIDDALQGRRKILGVQELRGDDTQTGANNKAQYIKTHLPVCNDPSVCESDGFIPEGRGGAVSIFADNEELRIVPEASTYAKLHGNKRIIDKDGETMVVFDKWLNLAMIEDKATGFRFVCGSTHLVRDQQIDGQLNTEAPEILDTLDQEMDIIETHLQIYLNQGYSVVLVADPNWDHDTPTIALSPPGRLARLGFVSMYESPGTINLSPDINGTHYKPGSGEGSRNLDAIYLANPKNPKQPFILSFSWRENMGQEAPSDHNLIVAGIDAIPILG